jgi:hypothetical protein
MSGCCSKAFRAGGSPEVCNKRALTIQAELILL